VRLRRRHAGVCRDWHPSRLGAAGRRLAATAASLSRAGGRLQQPECGATAGPSGDPSRRRDPPKKAVKRWSRCFGRSSAQASALSLRASKLHSGNLHTELLKHPNCDPISRAGVLSRGAIVHCDTCILSWSLSLMKVVFIVDTKLPPAQEL
jgi:hypothetical protein